MTASLPSAAAPLKIGTRGSPLALAQAHETRERLMTAHGLREDAFEVVVIKTTGDAVTDRPLGEIGGKGLFTKEIEEALLAGAIDIAVHSMKDMPTVLPDGLSIPCLLPREDVRDAFVSLRYESLAAMPANGVVGTSSLRRRAQLLHRFPYLKVVEFRGNVQTRLRKLAEGVAEARTRGGAGRGATPIGGLAEIEGDRLWFRGEIIRPDGSERLTAERRGPVADAAAMGADAAAELRSRAGPGFFDG